MHHTEVHDRLWIAVGVSIASSIFDLAVRKGYHRRPQNKRALEVLMPIVGKHALITGSSRGIGRGIALKLAEQGVKIAVHYYQNEAAAQTTLAKVRDRDSDGFIVQADVLDPGEIKLMFERVRSEFGQLDIFVSNARPELPTFFQPPLDVPREQ